MRVLLALLAGLFGAIGGAGGLGMFLAWLFTEIWGTFEGSAAMGGFSLGMPLGAIIGFALGLWLVLRKGAPSAGRTAAWLMGFVFALIIAGVVIFENA
ncbi:MAG: hypothetical protein JOY81_05980 [Alphaproteobacteria bacterium]|nr:hypothetical protein [Alphaproteobacteria bacterium]